MSVKRKRIITVTVGAILLLAALGIIRAYSRPYLLHLPLRDGAEFRVIQITYTAGPSDAIDHNINAPKARWWLYRHLPSPIQQRLGEPGIGIGNQASARPVLSIWWACIDPSSHKPLIGEAGDVFMTVDSGQRTNLGWPDPADDYRQIFVIDPPTDSKQLSFDFPIWGEWVHFRIDNPAYRP